MAKAKKKAAKKKPAKKAKSKAKKSKKKPAKKTAKKKPAKRAVKKKAAAATKKKKKKKIKPDFKEQAAFWRRFNTLICSGVPLLNALELAADECGNKGYVDIILDIRDQILAGKDFSAALYEYPEHFSPMVITMIQMGERTGSLDIMMDKVAEIVEQGLVTGKSAAKGKISEMPPPPPVMQQASSKEIDAMVQKLLAVAIEERASDIHIVSRDNRITIEFRIDGVMKAAYQLPKEKGTMLFNRLALLSNLDIAERRRPQDGRFRIRLGERNVDFRVSMVPTIHGPVVSLRVLTSEGLSLDLDTMGFQESVSRKLKDAAGGRNGLVIISGPHGSGKTTTMYAMLRGILSEERAVYTIEDPVEYAIDGVRQIQIDYKRGLTPVVALKVVMRQDPDILVAGTPIADLETLDLILKVASTGHLVFTHLDGVNIIDVMKRFGELNAESFLLASSLRFIGCQVLARKLCQECRKPVTVQAAKLMQIGFTSEEAENAKLFGPGGCEQCHGGYRGRLPFFEAMPVTDGIRDLIAAEAAPAGIKKKAVEEGMITLRRYGIMEALKGNTSLEEVLLHTRAD